MKDFAMTMMGHKFFESDLPSLIRELKAFNKEKTKEEKIAKLEQKIYAQLVARDFYQDDGGLSYDELKVKAHDAAVAFFSQES